MFFRNLTLFRFPAALGRNLDDLEACLDGHRLRPCGALELASRGFVSPLGPEEDRLTRTLDGCTLLALGQEDKLLPASVIAAETTRRVRARAASEGGPLGARQRRGIRQAVIEELLPKAFSKPSRTAAWLDRRQGWLVVDTASRRKAEDLLGQLRDALGSFAAVSPVPQVQPRNLLTHWLASGELPAGLALGEECELREPGADGGAVVRCQHQDLAGDEIASHLQSGKQVVRLGLQFEDRMSFVLGEDLVLRKFSLHDVVLEELPDEGDGEAELDAQFALMALEQQRLLEQLAGWFKLAPVEGD